MLGNASILENNNNTAMSPRRESRKRRRVSERRRVFSRLGVTSPNQPEPPFSAAAQRRASNMQGDSGRTLRSDSLAGGGGAFPANDQGKIAMKIQFHIVIAPENEPLILDDHYHHHLPPPPTQQQAPGQNKRQISTESTSISEHINERLNRQNSSTRRRQQLLAMHQQTAREDGVRGRTGSVSAGPTTPSIGEGDASPPVTIMGRDGLRSSTITSGMPHDEATMNFLVRQQQQQQVGGAARLRQQQGSGSLTSTSTGSLGNLVGQHQTLMASSNNIRARHEGREHIYFKRDGQRFGHEFTLKLAVDKSYRCLLKVRPLIPVAAISIQGHHVSFVDCSQTGSSAHHHSPLSTAALGGSLTLLNQAQVNNQPRHQSIGNLLSSSPGALSAARVGNHPNHRPSIPPTSHHHQNSDPTPVAGSRHQNHQHDQNSASLSSLSLSNHNGGGGGGGGHQQHVGSSAVRQQVQQQLVRQQQQHQMMRHFAGGGAGASSAGSAGQLVYMFDWSASRFEVNKNKARTQVHTVLKFKNGEILSLPLQVKFYEPECRQHLSWGSQLHFIDYDCQINSMGQIGVDRIQYY